MATKNTGKRCSTAALAKLAGVSPATVSRALNNHPYVTPEVQRKVMSAAYRLGYQPRLPAAGRRAAIVLGRYSEMQVNSYFTEMLRAISESCERHDLVLEIIGNGSSHLLNDNFIRVAICFLRVLSDEMLQSAPNTRFICVNFNFPGCASVCTDDAQGVTLGFNHLRDRGHRRIAMVLPARSDIGSCERRRRAFLELSAAAGCGNPEELIGYLNETPVECVAQLMRIGRPDALLIAGEDMLLPVNYALSLLNLRIPDDISVVSYENSHASQYMTPPHTTVAQNFVTLADRAVTCAIDILENHFDPAAANVIVPTRLIERNSVRCLN